MRFFPSLRSYSTNLIGSIAKRQVFLGVTSRIVYWLAYRLASVSHLLRASQTAHVAVALPMMLGYAVSNNLNPLAMGMIWSFSAGGKYFIGRLSAGRRHGLPANRAGVIVPGTY
ncbi:MAG: hypothetical protein O7A06_09410 [Acidobacteria bacterium]|nr:hypothetical protein [Acidobacteriota bacterium]